MSKTTARPRKMWAFEQELEDLNSTAWAQLILHTKKDQDADTIPILVFDASAAAHAERVEAVARALKKSEDEKHGYQPFTNRAALILRALSKAL